MIGALLAKVQVPRFYDAVNRRDLQRMRASMTEDATFVFPGGSRVSGVHSGKAAVLGWFESFFEQFPDFHFSVHRVGVTNIFDVLGTNTVMVTFEVEMRNRFGVEAHNRGVTVVRLQRGKMIHAEDFLHDSGENLRLAWADDGEAGAA